MSTSILPGERPDRLEEECAVFGVFAPGEDVARMTCFGLQALQHRGQESAGIAVGDGATVMVSKDLGLVTQVFDEASLAALEGFVAVGHARYSTSGGAASWEAAQPHISAIDDVLIALAHNGTLVNTNALRARLVDEGVQFRSGTDSEVAAKAIGRVTQETHHLRNGIRRAMEELSGAYAMVLASPDSLYAFRGVHLRVRVLRAPRQRDRRPERVPGAAQHGAHSGAGGARGGRPRAGRARLGRAVGHGLRV